MDITGKTSYESTGGESGAFYKTGTGTSVSAGYVGGKPQAYFQASRSWSGSSSSAQPSVSIGATGSGSAFSILSSYYTVHMWLRLT